MAKDRHGRKQARGARDAGRERLLEAARALFRLKVKHEVSRQDIARAAGATPALMSYHFGNNSELVLAATRPVLAEAISELFVVLDAPTTVEARLREIIGLFIDFARINGALLDIFVEVATEDADGQALVQKCLARLSRFFSEAVDANLIASDSNPRFLLLALWGMCRLVAESPSLPYAIFEPGVHLDDQRRAQSELILKLVLHGVGIPNSPRNDVPPAPLSSPSAETSPPSEHFRPNAK